MTSISKIKKIKVGSARFGKLKPKEQWTLAWRRAHMFGGHGPVRKYARKVAKVKPSSKLKTQQLVHYIRLQESSGGRFFKG